MKQVANGPISLMTESFGAPEDPALVLVMGATASMLSWPDALCRRLAAGGFRVIRFDHRDTGQSTTGPAGEPGYAVEDMVGDVFAVLDGQVEMRYRQDGQEHRTLLGAGDVFFAGVGCEHVAHPLGEARILVIEKEGSE